MNDLDHFIELLRSLYQKKAINDDFAWQLSISAGALLGEMIRTEHPLVWQINDGIPVLAMKEEPAAFTMVF